MTDGSRPIHNPRREKFANLLAQGRRTEDECYEMAGYAPSRANASRTARRPDIAARVAWLRTKAAEQTMVTIRSTTAELEAARTRAEQKDDPNTMRLCSMDKAKINGILIDRHVIGLKRIEEMNENELRAVLGIVNAETGGGDRD